MLQRFVTIVGGNPHKREIGKLSGFVDAVNALEADFEKLNNEALRAKTDEFRAKIASALEGIEDEEQRSDVEQDVLDDILYEAFATVREASKRTLGLRHYDVQIIGGTVLHSGRIAEMRTGEGKTLVATLPLYLNALTGRGVHLITVNDYLARRDARWMGPIFDLLGLSVGILQMAASTENGKKAFLYDPSKESPHEDQDKLRLVERRLAYQADITYGTNSEFGFDYLRDNMVYRPAEKVQRGHYFAIIDEVDNVLIDEARTPLIISGPAEGDLKYYTQMAQLVRQLNPEDYEVSEKDRGIALTEVGTVHVEQLLGQPLRDPDRPEDVTPEQARLSGYLEQALRAQYVFKRNKDYLVQGGKVIIVDEYTGRLMPGRRWSDGLHQAVEAKEGVKIEPENVTYATITLQNYFRMYEKLAGMTGTAVTESEEFDKIYKLDVLPIPTNLEYNAMRPDSPLVEVKSKDEDGYEIVYYSSRDDSQKTPAFWRRTDYPDLVYRTEEAKLRSLITAITRDHVAGRPILVGTTSVESSERLSNRLHAEPIRRLLQVHLLRRAWFEHNDREEDGRINPELQPLSKPLEELEPSALRQFAKSVDLASINPEEPDNLSKLLTILRLDSSSEARLKAVLQAGVPHEVLNARKHTEESQIIAGAGAFGAVTIATNMAGRGVDIKLGGELADEIIATVSRVLRRAGYDPYNMRLEEQRQALIKMDPAEFGIYDSEVRFFLQYFEDMERVRELGGLHVIGSERHDARRIDNQLRGRSARQGDPGSSRFYLSLQDDLMRLFGGDQVDNLMQRFRLDDEFPLENRMVTNLIESSQHRVEGSNFDVRKHLLDYDDVLNKQRTIVYSQRDRVMSKDDLAEDVAEMLRTEVAARVPPAMEDEEGPWKLLAWLEQIQPSFAYGDNKIFPSFTYRMLLDDLSQAEGEPRAALLDVARRAVQAEETHIMRAIELAIAGTADSLETQAQERFDAIDTFIEAQRDSEERRRPQELIDELQGLIHLPLRLNNEQVKLLVNDPEQLEEPLKDMVDAQLSELSVSRLVSTIEFRLNESLPDKAELSHLGWDQAATKMLQLSRKMLENRLERLAGKNGQIPKELDNLLARKNVTEMDEAGMVVLLSRLARGRRMDFDSKTHRQVARDYQRFNYIYLTAQMLIDGKPEDVELDVLEHLQDAMATLRSGYGQFEYNQLAQSATHVADFGQASKALESVSPDAPLSSLNEQQRAAMVEALGHRRQTEIYRNVLLGAISELWVDYLTRVEALRVSIGLEAYAQRDPLVQYKSKASEMFQELLRDIRAGVIGHIFLYLPRPVSTTEPAIEPSIETEQPQAQSTASSRAGRKRHKKR